MPQTLCSPTEPPSFDCSLRSGRLFVRNNILGIVISTHIIRPPGVLSGRVMISTGSLARASVFDISKLRRVAPMGTRTWAVFTRECRVSVATMVQVACSLPRFPARCRNCAGVGRRSSWSRATSCLEASGRSAALFGFFCLSEDSTREQRYGAE